MKTLIEKWTPAKGSSFDIKQYIITQKERDKKNIFMRRHDEFEITVITGGSGKRIIGNTIGSFFDGDVFIIGPNVPHSVQYDPGEMVEVITTHFSMDGFGNGFFDLPENAPILNLLRDAYLGVTFKGTARKEIAALLKQLMVVDSFDRMLNFFRLLHKMALLKNRQLISKRGFSKITTHRDYELVNRTYRYIISNFDHQDISLNEMATYLNMSPSTFCRFFKKHFYKTYTAFLNEVRIGHACKLLQESDKNIAQIGFASGYNHLTHFNKQFKKIIGYSPKEYRRQMD